MSDQTLIQKLDDLHDVDYTDPATYKSLLGYDEPATQEAPKAETEPAPQEAKTESSAPAGTAETTETQEAAGVATKDGKRVIPYAVLQDERTARAAAAARAAELQAKVDQLTQQLQAKETPEQKPDDFTEDELSEMERDFPAMAKLAKNYRALQAQVATRPAAPAPQPFDVQPLIDERPLLAKWQAKGNAAWNEAVKLDVALQQDPEWMGKPVAERFAEVERRIAEDLGIPTTPVSKAAAAQAPAPKPQPVQEVTPTLTDFNGTAAAVGDPLKGMAVGQMVDATNSMSIEEIRRMVGLSY